MSVSRAYAVQGAVVERVLIDSSGRVFAPDAGEFAVPARDVQVFIVPGEYHTWSDVPSSWVGGCPYWR